ncbi:hypothetical protein MY04_0113 [Flammeovirga sp. MY04]|uniref:hypothetical protein n=1 Tax=Flammeovirga sp. MY04 TaxID=1191459 RepID=UPI000806440A|nr:hypothetical protein [Flammeovirga sp. MY04]ANQ47495.1 hypothetical protein MY04_0113 [Flammeovirga sp. MY04]
MLKKSIVTILVFILLSFIFRKYQSTNEPALINEKYQELVESHFPNEKLENFIIKYNVNEYSQKEDVDFSIKLISEKKVLFYEGKMNYVNDHWEIQETNLKLTER